LDDYVLKNLKYFKRMLVIYMVKSGESLEWVVDQIMMGRRIEGTGSRVSRASVSKFHSVLGGSGSQNGNEEYSFNRLKSDTGRQSPIGFRSNVSPLRPVTT
jgi:hypothetical protein